jgi:trans-aconitate methyltransferase
MNQPPSRYGANYTVFQDERTRPVRDQIVAVPNSVVRISVDLGCGPANSTQVLATRYPDAVIIGLDRSTDMIGAGRAKAYPTPDDDTVLLRFPRLFLIAVRRRNAGAFTQHASCTPRTYVAC